MPNARLGRSFAAATSGGGTQGARRAPHVGANLNLAGLWGWMTPNTSS
jgi:hypothetical protein